MPCVSSPKLFSSSVRKKPVRRYQAVVHIDHALLSAETPTPTADSPAGARPVLCELEDGPTLAIETARRLACDGALVGLVDDAEGQPLNVGRRTRAIPPSLKRALKARDKGCRFPGCPHTRYTQGHHVRHCHLVHEGGFCIEATHDGVFRFLDPAGEPVNEDFAVSGRFHAESRLLRSTGIAACTLGRTPWSRAGEARGWTFRW
jgi:hypothetical protein